MSLCYFKHKFCSRFILYEIGRIQLLFSISHQSANVRKTLYYVGTNCNAKQGRLDTSKIYIFGRMFKILKMIFFKKKLYNIALKKPWKEFNFFSLTHANCLLCFPITLIQFTLFLAHFYQMINSVLTIEKYKEIELL